MNELLSRLTSDPEICHGQLCLRGLRYPVSMILELLAGGMSEQEILSDYPDLEADDIRASLTYAAQLSETKSILKVVA
jgi:uncharacterized protein (DUF433 family)